MGSPSGRLRFVLVACLASACGDSISNPEAVGPPRSRFVFAPLSGPGRPSSMGVSVVRADLGTGRLELVPGSPFAPGTSPLPGVVHPNGRWLYVGDLISNEIQPLLVDGSGSLSPLAPPMRVGERPARMAITPSGRFLYVVAPFAKAPPVGFSVDASTGALSPLPTPPVSLELPSEIKVHPSGRFMVVTHGSTFFKGVTVLRIDAETGALTRATNTLTFAGTLPQRIAFTPSGAFVYTAAVGSDELWGFHLNPDTGVLTPVPGAPYRTGSQPQSVAVNPTGEFVLVAHLISIREVLVYRIEAQTGALTPVPGSPFAVERGANDFAMDPGGRYVYASHYDNRALSTLSLDPMTGTVAPVPGSMIPLSNTPIYLAVSPLIAP